MYANEPLTFTMSFSALPTRFLPVKSTSSKCSMRKLKMWVNTHCKYLQLYYSSSTFWCLPCSLLFYCDPLHLDVHSIYYNYCRSKTEYILTAKAMSYMIHKPTGTPRNTHKSLKNIKTLKAVAAMFQKIRTKLIRFMIASSNDAKIL